MIRRFLIFLAACAVTAWALSYFAYPGRPADATFAVTQDESTSDVIAGLKERGFVRSTLLFKVALWRSGLAAKLQPGRHDLAGARTYGEIIKALASGGVTEAEVTIIVREGWTLADIEGELLRLHFDGALHLYEVTGERARDYGERGFSAFDRSGYEFLADKSPRTSLEGYLFPDTYRLFKTGTAEDAVETMLRNFGNKLSPEIRAEVAGQGWSIYDTVTLASIIEKEVRSDDDRAMVSDIFRRRLKEGMALQADSTVNYVTGGGAASASWADIEIDSPYNTYKYRGLPLGPICNPGISAITAAIRPKPNPYVYFLTDKDGNVHYARTFEEHKRNRALYLR